MSDKDKFSATGTNFYNSSSGAHFATHDELKEKGYAAGGRLSFGYVPPKTGEKDALETSYNGEKMAMLFAPPRSGKGTTICRMTMDHPGSLVCFSPRGEEAMAAYKHRKEKMGQKVVLIDPLNIVAKGLGVEPDTLDMMGILDPESDLFFEDCFALADGFSIPPQGENSFFFNSALDYQTSAIAFAAAHPIDDKPMTLSEALDFFSMGTGERAERLVGEFEPFEKGKKKS